MLHISQLFQIRQCWPHFMFTLIQTTNMLLLLVLLLSPLRSIEIRRKQFATTLNTCGWGRSTPLIIHFIRYLFATFFSFSKLNLPHWETERLKISPKFHKTSLFPPQLSLSTYSARNVYKALVIQFRSDERVILVAASSGTIPAAAPLATNGIIIVTITFIPGQLNPFAATIH